MHLLKEKCLINKNELIYYLHKMFKERFKIFHSRATELIIHLI